jgi:hypothetical protein
MAQRFKQLYKQVGSIAVSKLIYDDGILLIQGFDRHHSLVVEISFPDILTVRISGEGVRLRLIGELDITNSLVLVDEDSQLLTWVLEEGLHTRDMEFAKHFIVLVGEEIYDVVSISEPQITSP